MQKILGPLSMLITIGVLGVLAYPYISKLTAGLSPILNDVPRMVADTALPFSLPEGFSAHLYAFNAPGVRVLTRDPSGVLIASLTSEGVIGAFPDNNNDGLSDEMIVIADNLQKPHGILFLCNEESSCSLYVAEEKSVSRFSYNPETLKAKFAEKVMELPSAGGGQHFTRTLHLHPDGKRLLVSVGSSCNVCNEDDERRAAILALDLETKKVSIYARGLRNTVFMETNPYDGSIWGTDMGRDLLGDDIPPDEVNVITENGNYGWPTCFGMNMHDTDFDKNTYIRNPCMKPFETPAKIALQAHSAPLGIAFIPEEGWPEMYRGDILVAYHGSWNRSVPTGYKIVRFDYSYSRNYLGEEIDFMTGFLNSDGEALGRPVDILVEPGGTMFVSDDRAGVIYRILYTEPLTTTSN
ncbi:PQQ-dependent sugar dehydrogenase [Patescibacteria group bacterium]|nr:PQQ-dependent sugar dehydrogenase [Patescibacteria group bacterium]